MTEVRIYGFLSKIIEKNYLKVYLGRLKDVFSALDSIIPNFRKKILELNSKGYIYEIKIHNNIIHIIPSISGSRNFWKKVLGVFTIIVAIFVMIYIDPSLGWAIFQAGIQLLGIAFRNPLKYNKVEGYTGGSIAYASSGGRSYVFSNNQNIASQGSLIPIGYGLIKTSSRILAVSVKNYKSSDTFSQENFFRFSEPENSTFL
jgi:predicted phage tail protein